MTTPAEGGAPSGGPGALASTAEGGAPSGAAGVHARLSELGATVAVAESLTGGLLCAALTDPPGASATVRGGLVVYASDLKAALAGVSEALLAERGAVDPAVALALAHGARARLGATFGVGVTGVAGPDPQDGKAVGTVFAAVGARTATRYASIEPRATAPRSEPQRSRYAWIC